MGILVGKDTKVLVQGITGKEGSFHTEKMLEYGTRIVAGVTPGRGGTSICGIPVYDTVREAHASTEIDASVLFVPPPVAADALMEALMEDIRMVACITEGIPVKDMVKVRKVACDCEATLIGPNCPGIVTISETKLGIMPASLFSRGSVGVVSRSGTLTYLIVEALTEAGIGQSTCVGIGGDSIVGTSFMHMLSLFRDDPATEVVVLIGEIGGTQEEEAAEYIREYGIPVVAYIAGKTAPPGRRMGHAGAIVSGGKGTAEGKIKALREAGVSIASTVSETVEMVKSLLPESSVAVMSPQGV
ncbi:MAG: succinate--CoA ligase subunit alpha [Vulcanimicrobiota bacterium]